MLLAFALPLSAQKSVLASSSSSSLHEDTAIFPHDFNDEYYARNGVSAPSIIARRNGYDYLSVIGWSSDPTHSNVRVLVTLPAYNENGEIRFWVPLGELTDKGFTDDGTGMEAREIANLYPIFIFPKSAKTPLASFADTRQAAVIDETQNAYYAKGNPLGLRTIFSVNFTEKAFTTKEGLMMMESLGKKNGRSFDGTPLLKFRDEIYYLYKLDLVTLDKQALWEEPQLRGTYAISPYINNYGAKNVIAPDAFLLMPTDNGQMSPDEMIFSSEFGCLKKYGVPCESVK